MGTRFHIGAKSLESDISAYSKRFDLLEVYAARPRGPSPTTMKRWRKTVPPAFEFAVVVGPHVAALRPSEELDSELESALEAVRVLQSRCLVIRTPLEVTPSAVWRQRMAKLLERIPRDVTQVVWEPRGVWELEDAVSASKKWDVVLAVDASRDPVPAGPVAYVRLPQLGETRSFGEAALEKVVAKIGARRDAYVVVETETALKEAKRIRRLAQGTRAGRGGARVLRPRVATVKVRDDEQE